LTESVVLSRNVQFLESVHRRILEEVAQTFAEGETGHVASLANLLGTRNEFVDFRQAASSPQQLNQLCKSVKVIRSLLKQLFVRADRLVSLALHQLQIRNHKRSLFI